MRVLAVLAVAACGRVDFAEGPRPIVYLPLDELVAGTTPGGGTCSDPQCPAIVPGRLGNAARFDGIDDRIRIASVSPQDFTIAAWIRPAQAPTDLTCPFSKLLGTGLADSWQLCLREDLGTYFFSSEGPDGPGDISNGQVPVALDTWHHVVISWADATHEKHTWLDGQVVAASLAGAAPIAYDDGDILLGIDVDFGSDISAFAGAIDDFRIYDQVLAPDELM